MRYRYHLILAAMLSSTAVHAVDVQAEPPRPLASFFGLARPALQVITDHHGPVKVYIDERGLPMQYGSFLPYSVEGECPEPHRPQQGLQEPCVAKSQVAFDGIRIRRLDANFCEVVETTVQDLAIVRTDGIASVRPQVAQREWKVPCGYNPKTKYPSTVTPVKVKPAPVEPELLPSLSDAPQETPQPESAAPAQSRRPT